MSLKSAADNTKADSSSRQRKVDNDEENAVVTTILESGPLQGARLSGGPEYKLTTRSCANIDCWQRSFSGDFVSEQVAGSLQRLKLDKFRYLSSLEDDVFAKLKNLTHLSLTRCDQLTSLPDSIGSLQNLKTVRRRIKFVSDDRMRLLAYAYCSNFRFLIIPSLQLDLTDCSSIACLPDSICSLPNLRKLLLGHVSSGNKVLTQLPMHLGNLVNLQVLVLDKCKTLESLPESIGNLTLLQELQMRECKSITSLPESIGNCRNLREVGLSKCFGLVGLPASICQWTKLEELLLTKCKKIQQLPEELGCCSSISVLDLRNCKTLECLPASMGQLTNLRILDVSHCKALKEIPDVFDGLEKLSQVHCSDLLAIQTLPSSLQAKPEILIGWNEFKKK
jgi:Leucine-rich repeat (LRR) protein